jgi:hypothetical protein
MPWVQLSRLTARPAVWPAQCGVDVLGGVAYESTDAAEGLPTCVSVHVTGRVIHVYGRVACWTLVELEHSVLDFILSAVTQRRRGTSRRGRNTSNSSRKGGMLRRSSRPREISSRRRRGRRRGRRIGSVRHKRTGRGNSICRSNTSGRRSAAVLNQEGCILLGLLEQMFAESKGSVLHS